MQTSCAAILGIILLVLTNLAIIICFATPYWLEARHIYTRGLWAHCDDRDCTWMFQDEFAIQKHLPVWYQVAQGLITAGLTCSLIGLLIATLVLCCQCQNCNGNHAVAGLLLITFLVMGVGIIIFAIKSSKEFNASIEWTVTGTYRFGWSFWMAICACGMSLITAIVYACMGRRYYA
ncbi:hypothetical protein ScPMuIL_007824 [Solemya velum]